MDSLISLNTKTNLVRLHNVWVAHICRRQRWNKFKSSCRRHQIVTIPLKELENVVVLFLLSKCGHMIYKELVVSPPINIHQRSKVAKRRYETLIVTLIETLDI